MVDSREDDQGPAPGRPRAVARALLAGALALSVAGGAAVGQSRSSSETLVLPAASEELRQRIQETITLGLGSLADRQAPDGHIGSRYPVATTALAGLAVLGAGIHPEREPYDRVLSGCVRYLLQSRDDGYITELDKGPRSDAGSRMHGHCYALLFFTQIAGLLPLETNREVRAAITRGVRVIESAQSREGGWWYTRESGVRDEASVTICAVQTLRAARNTGFAVDSGVIDAGVRYVERCQTPSGSFRYSLSDGVDRATFALTAAAVSTLNAAGVYKGLQVDEPSRTLRKGMDFLHRAIAAEADHPEDAVEEQFFYYGNLYAAQALFQEGGDAWETWYERVSRNLLAPRHLRSDAGAIRWESRYGDEYATAVVLLILEIPLGYLPIFQR